MPFPLRICQGGKEVEVNPGDVWKKWSTLVHYCDQPRFGADFFSVFLCKLHRTCGMGFLRHLAHISNVQSLERPEGPCKKKANWPLQPYLCAPISENLFTMNNTRYTRSDCPWWAKAARVWEALRRHTSRGCHGLLPEIDSACGFLLPPSSHELRPED